MADLATASMQAHRTSVESSTASIAQFLQEVLGQKLVAYMAGVDDPKTVGRWASGARTPQAENETRLRQAFHVFQLLNIEESPHTIRAWFMGLNPQLDDESPAAAIRDGRARDVIIAAKAFLSGG
jgi:hypothetical protein